MWKLGVAVMASLAFACGGNDAVPSDAAGDAGACNGCVGARGCELGNAPTACGNGGVACTVCSGDEVCGEDGRCTAPPTCNPSNCDGCCDAGGTCHPGITNASCGFGGIQCSDCGADAACNTSTGTCMQLCGPDTCTGCCAADGTCVTTDDAAQCGTGGAACASCGAGLTCVDGDCVDAACAASCNGCCQNGTCIPIDDQIGSCGRDGAACAACGSGKVCDEGTCFAYGSVDCSDGCYTVDGVCHPGTEQTRCGEENLGGPQLCLDCGPELRCYENGDGADTSAKGCNYDRAQHYDVVVLNATVPQLSDNGYNWDPFGLPDVYLTVSACRPGTLGCTSADTPVKNDTLTPSWGQLAVVSNVTGDFLDHVYFDVWDSDVDFDDEIETMSRAFVAHEQQSGVDALTRYITQGTVLQVQGCYWGDGVAKCTINFKLRKHL